MRYFLVTVSVRDGEYEYWRHVPVRAKTSNNAVRRGLKSDEDWTKDDYREVSYEGIQEIPKADYDVLARYL